MLLVTFPDCCRAERRWICSVVLGEFLGLPHEMRFDGHTTTRIAAEGKTLDISDAFFAGSCASSAECWLSETSLPAQPLPRWTVHRDDLAPVLADPRVPIIFGESGFGDGAAGFSEAGDHAMLSLDVFGSAFFMLSRYEEAVLRERDEYDRFPAKASLAYREGFLFRPIVDEYVEILWTSMTRLWPGLQRKQRSFGSFITCDVDHPYHPSAASLPRLVRRTAGRLIRPRCLADVIAPVRNYVASRNGDWRNDPYYHAVDWIMDVNERAGNVVAFNFIPENTDPALDGICSIEESAIKAMIKRIGDRGHEIGIHPGYNTYLSRRAIFSGKNKLQRVMAQQRIGQAIAGGRQHYLRWSTRTPALWEAAGLEYDSTLGYASHAGFRCGTSHSYPMYDLHERKALKLRQRPLICMEFSVACLMGYGFTDAALGIMKTLKNAARLFNGTFTLLWHNDFEAEGAREIYCEIIGS
jgi:peptidoglycan/xylan/chitin deacetylase (PgdA/CDA1 family)